MLGIHPDTVRRAARDGELKAARFGRSLRISLAEISVWFAAKGGGELGQVAPPQPLPVDLARALAAAEDAKNAVRAATRGARSEIWAAEDLDHIYDYMDALLDIASAHLYKARPDRDSTHAERMLDNAEARRTALFESHASCRVLAGYYLLVLCRDLNTVLITLGPGITARVAQIASGQAGPWRALARPSVCAVVDELSAQAVPIEMIVDLRGDDQAAVRRDTWLTVFEGYEHLGAAFNGGPHGSLWALIDGGPDGLRWLPVRATAL